MVRGNVYRRLLSKNNKYKENGETNTTYRFRNGSKIQLPSYYKNKLYTEEERDKLWTKLLDDDIYYICNSKYNGKDEEERQRLLAQHREEKWKLQKIDWDELEKNKKNKNLKRYNKIKSKKDKIVERKIRKELENDRKELNL